MLYVCPFVFKPVRLLSEILFAMLLLLQFNIEMPKKLQYCKFFFIETFEASMQDSALLFNNILFE